MSGPVAMARFSTLLSVCILGLTLAVDADPAPAPDAGYGADATPGGDAIPQWGSFDGFIHLRAYEEAYPDRVEAVEFRDGDWAIRMDGIWFYWANGRLLPQKARPSWEEWAPMRLYRYTPGPYAVPPVSPEAAVLLHTWIDRDPAVVPRRHNGFYGVLYDALSPRQARAASEVVGLFGFRVRVHRLLVGPLGQVDQEVRAAAVKDPDLAAFLRRLAHIDGQHWREVAGTRSLSMHAYGTAVDLIPGSYQRQFSYWRWAAEAGITEWWALPVEDRWLPPPSLVEIFERNGFVWGGRWLFFDSIHFEYRPEIYRINGIVESGRW
jgi:hypothetical protein